MDIQAEMALLSSYIEKYGVEPLPHDQVEHKPATSYPPSVVLLTGATGNLGSDLLAMLLAQQQVTKIYALNRAAKTGHTPQERIVDRFKSKRLDLESLNSGRVVFLEGDTSEATLGLGEQLFAELQSNVTVIIHNAWPINLSYDVTFFEPNLQGLHNLLNLMRYSARVAEMRLVFVSSFSSASGYTEEFGVPIPEESLPLEAGARLQVGYSKSKFIAERIIAKSGLDATALRVTQLCGRIADGAWSRSEWIPVLMNASLSLNAFPSAHGVLAFLPLDAAAECITDVAFYKGRVPCVLNMRHPRPFKWNLLVDTLNTVVSGIRGTAPLPVVSMSQWTILLEQSANKPTPATKVALKLLFLVRAYGADSAAIKAAGLQDIEHFPRPTGSIEKAQLFSPTLKNLQEISQADAMRWVEYWISTKVLMPEPLQPSKL